MLFAAVAACGVPEQRDDGALVEVRRDALDAVASFGTNPGALRMFRYVPAGLETGRPVVVVLHGCGDTANGFSTSWSAWTTLADARRFSLVYPEQQTSNNSGGCFNWFEAGDQLRDQGELLSVKQMVDKTIADTQGSARWYVVGFSAGAASAVNLLAAYPDSLAGGAIAAGVAYRCAQNVTDAFSCMMGGGTQTPATWAMRARQAYPAFAGTWPRVSIWHGLADSTVDPANRTELMEQWTALHGADQTADGTSTIASGGTRTVFRAGGAASVVELNDVPGLGHAVRTAWATDMADFFGLAPPMGTGGGAGGGAAGGGSAGGSGGGAAGGTAGGSAGGASGGTAGGTAGGSAGGTGGAGGAGGSGGGGTTEQPGGCATVPGIAMLAALALLKRRKTRLPDLKLMRRMGLRRGG